MFNGRLIAHKNAPIKQEEKTMKKRWLSLLLSLLMVFTILPLSASAENSAGTVDISITEKNGKTAVSVGDTVTYTIAMSSADDLTLAALEFTLVIPSQLQVVSSSASALEAAGQKWEDLHLAAYGMNYALGSNSTELLTVTCKAVSAGSIALSIENECFVIYGDSSDWSTQEILNVQLNSSSLTISSTASTPSTGEDDKDSSSTGSSSSSSDGKLSASEIRSEFNSSKKDTVTFDVSEDALVSRMLFTLLASNDDKTAVLQGDGYSWTFSGEDITGSLNANYFDSTVTSTSSKKSAIQKLTGDATIQIVHVAHEGMLPGVGTLTVSVDKALKNKTLYCYYYNAETKSLELVAADLTVKNGKVSFAVDRGQDYILTDTLLTLAGGTKANPETGAGFVF